MNDLLKADMLTRFNAYKTALESNWINIDEIRKREDLSPMGIDFVSMNLANVFYYPKTKKHTKYRCIWGFDYIKSRERR